MVCEVAKQPERPLPETQCLQNSDARFHNHNDVQDDFDASSHRYVGVDDSQYDSHGSQSQHDIHNIPDASRYRNASVDEPPDNSHGNEGHYKVNERHFLYFLPH